MTEVINKVAQSGLKTIDLEKQLAGLKLTPLDIAPYLFQGLLLKEKDFRAALKATDWATFDAAWVCVWCSTDALIPQWAWMLVASALQPHASRVFFGAPEAVKDEAQTAWIRRLDLEQYRNERVIIKGCGLDKAGPAAFTEISLRLAPIVKSLMYGEACSTVPILKNKP